MSDPKYPKLTLPQAILKTIAEHTGREVRGAEITTFSDFLSITVEMAEDGGIDVSFEDPLHPTAVQR